MKEYEKLCADVKKLKDIAPFAPKVAIVLGSGLGSLLKEDEIIAFLNYSELEYMPISTVDGHRGRFVFTEVSGVPVVAMQGRVHLYEGYSACEVVRPIRLMKMLGVNKLILTNAAGGINRDFSCGDAMLIKDHISSFVPSPLIGENIPEFGTRFPDMSNIYSKSLQAIARKSAEKVGVDLKSGIYLQTTGPNFESPAEIKMYSLLGADAVGMSTTIEAITAAHMNMDVLGISLITNAAAGISDAPLSNEEVNVEAEKASGKMSALIAEVIKGIGEIND